jgi:hypothetical protein
MSDAIMVETVKSIVAIVKLRSRAGLNTGEASNASTRLRISAMAERARAAAPSARPKPR